MFALKTHQIKRACYTGSAVIYVKLSLVAGLFYSKMAGLICISHNYECYRKQMQVFEAALVCICQCAFNAPVAQQKVIDQHGARVERYNLVQLLVRSFILDALKYFLSFPRFVCTSNPRWHQRSGRSLPPHLRRGPSL